MIDREFPVGESPSVKVGTRSGLVRVEAGRPGVVRVVVDTRDPGFEVTQRGDVIHASSDKGGRADVIVHAPPLTDVEVATASADVNLVLGVRRLEVSTASGDVTFDTADRLQMKSANGAVRGNQVTGEARCVTASGDIRRHRWRTSRSVHRIRGYRHRAMPGITLGSHSVRGHTGSAGTPGRI